jgi:glycosyltransferase involved in cell wall biosynthesis
MRLGIATHNYPPHLGGLEAIVRELTRGFARFHDVVVVTTAWDGRNGISAEDGATILRLPAWHGSERRGVPYATPYGPGVGRALAELRTCDVLHAHGSLYATTLLALAASRSGAPLFVTEHVGFVAYPMAAVNVIEHAAWGAIGNPVIRRSKKVIAYNGRVRDWLRARFGADRVAFIANGIDTEMFRPADAAARRAVRERFGLPPDAVLALFVGRAAQKKNLDAVLAFPSPGYRLVVCGAERKLPPEVINLGPLPHATMPDVFAAADFLLHPATGEGFPVTIQEAMASALPVAVLWDDGYAASVDRGAVLAACSLEALAREATTIAASSSLRAEYGARAREFAVAHWRWGATVDQYLQLFGAATHPRS